MRPRMNTDGPVGEAENWGRKILLVERFFGGKRGHGRLSGSFSINGGAAIRGGQNANRATMAGIVSVDWKIFLPTESSCLCSDDFLLGGTTCRFQAVRGENGAEN